MRDLLIVLGAVVLVILSSPWWPAIGQRCYDTWALYTWHRQIARDRRKWVMPAWTGPDSPQTPVPVDDPDDEPTPMPEWMLDVTERDLEWADELHAINLATHRDRPIHQLTHYEIEAVIRDLAVPEWVPERWRQAA